MKKILLVVISIIVVGAAAWITISRSLEKTRGRTECFENVFSDESVIKAKFTFMGDTATGTLAYLWINKDNSTGTYNAVIKNGVLTGNYHFFSEGMWSDRQVVFSYDGQSLVPAYGEMNDQFEPKDRMVKAECSLSE